MGSVLVTPFRFAVQTPMGLAFYNHRQASRYLLGTDPPTRCALYWVGNSTDLPRYMGYIRLAPIPYAVLERAGHFDFIDALAQMGLGYDSDLGEPPAR